MLFHFHVLLTVLLGFAIKFFVDPEIKVDYYINQKTVLTSIPVNTSTDGLFYRQLTETSGLVALAPMGVFNFPWEYHTTVMSKSRKFLELVEGNLLSQVLSEPTRMGALLNLSFVNR